MPPEATKETPVTPETPPVTEPTSESPAIEVKPTEPVITTIDLSDEELLERVAKLDRAKLLSHNTIAGIVGSKADELAKKRLQDENARRAAEEAARERARLDKLLDENPIEYADEEKKRREAERQQQIAWNYTDAVLAAQFELLPDVLKTEFNGKQWPSRQEYLDAMVNRYADYKAELKTPTAIEAERARLKAEHEETLKAERAREKADRIRWENETKEALRKELLGQTVGSEPSPDQGVGGKPNSNALTDDEWQLNKKNRQWTLQNLSRIQEAMNAGRLRS